MNLREKKKLKVVKFKNFRYMIRSLTINTEEDLSVAESRVFERDI